MAKQIDAAQQAYQWAQEGRVLKSVMASRGIGAKIKSAATAKWNAKTGSPYTKNTTGTARALRLVGADKSALIFDALFGGNLDKRTKKQIAQEAKEQQEEKKERKKAYRTDTTSKKAFVSIKKDLGYIRKDLFDIKSLLMPKGVVAKDKNGQTKFVQYNPLAPQGEQFNTVTESGKLTAMPPGKGFQASAQKKAALATAQLALKILEEDKKKEKYRWKDKKEEFRKKDPLGVLTEKVDALTEKVDALGKPKSNGLLGMLGTMLTGLLGGLLGKLKTLISPIFKILGPIAKAIGSVAKWAGKFGMFVMKTMWSAIRAMSTGLWKLIGKWFPGLTIPGLIGAGAAAATTGAMALALDKGMKQGADKAIDGVMTDVTKKIKNSGFEKDYSEEQKYQMYKTDMDKAYDSEDNPERKAYKQQQWLNSEGLSDTEKAMARRYFHEKNGGSRGPKSRGGRRGSATPAPAWEDSDSFDTNYVEEVVVSTPKQTGELSRKNEVSGEDAIKKQIKQHEGLRLKPYKDTKGLWTIGYGHLIGKNLPEEWNRTITKEEAEAIFEKDYAEHRKAAEKIPGFDKMNEKGKRALIDLTFNMGADWVRVKGFKRFEAAMNQPTPDVNKAAQSLEESLWYDQVKGRAKVVVNDLRAGLSPVSSGGPIMAAVTPQPTVSGGAMDSATRSLQASNSPQAGTPVVATTVVNNQTNNNVGKRPMAKADVVTRDEALVRSANRDSRHPVLG
jgi:lysozyme